jgi:hypothetical protein
MKCDDSCYATHKKSIYSPRPTANATLNTVNKTGKREQFIDVKFSNSVVNVLPYLHVYVNYSYKETWQSEEVYML